MFVGTKKKEWQITSIQVALEMPHYRIVWFLAMDLINSKNIFFFSHSFLFSAFESILHIFFLNAFHNISNGSFTTVIWYPIFISFQYQTSFFGRNTIWKNNWINYIGKEWNSAKYRKLKRRKMYNIIKILLRFWSIIRQSSKEMTSQSTCCGSIDFKFE